MKYESSILKRLIDTYGVIGNPRYLSEIIKEFIVRGKELYPQLFTYQSDWLAHIDEFGLTPEYTVSYTGQHIYAPNTKEKPVKSAILKGNTGYRDIDTGEFLETFEEGRNLELVSVKMPVLTSTGKNLWSDEVINALCTLENWEGNGAYRINKKAYNLINFQKEQTYTTSIPALSIPPKFYPILSIVNEDDRGIGAILASGIYNNQNEDTEKVVDEKVWEFTIPKDGSLAFQAYVGSWNVENMNKLHRVLTQPLQVEKGTVKTSYEPHKTNILTVNEEVELRGIGDVRDTLDLMTGQVTERIGEVVLDGSENWVVDKDVFNNNTYRFILTIGNMIRKNWHDTITQEQFVKSNVFRSLDLRFEAYSLDTEHLTGWDSSRIVLSINKAKLSENSVNALKTYLQQNPITVQYQLATESIKTVGLTIHDKDQQKVERLTSFEGGTHFTTSSQDGSLLPTLTVDVVTDLEETLAVCSLEGNTM